MSLRLGAYTRLSRDRDGTETATKRQLAACEKWAKEHGHKVVARYRDSDLSGFKRRTVRPDFQRLLTDLEAGQIDGVVVWRTDRFTRQPIEVERFLEMAEGNGAQLCSVTEPFDNSAMGLYMLRGFVNSHNLESAVKSERLKAKHEELARDGKTNGGIRPFGFEADRVTLNMEEADLLREAAAYIIAGGSLYSLAEDWAGRGITTTLGNRWSAKDLRRVLTNGRACGQRVHLGKEVGPAQWLAIITVETRDQINAALAARWSGATRDHYVRTHLLTGFLECSQCHVRMVAQRHQGAGTYVCVRSAITGACGKVRVRGAELDEFVGEAVVHRLSLPKVTKRLRAAPSVNEAGAVAEVRALEAKSAELAEEWGNDRITSVAWASASRTVEARLVTARRRLEQRRRATALAVLPVEGMGDAWGDLDLHQRRSLIEAVVDRIDVRPIGKGSHRPVQDRVDVVWRV